MSFGDAIIGEGGMILLPYSVITQSTVGPRAQVGPFLARSPGGDISARKPTSAISWKRRRRSIRPGAKANHLAYLGDGDIGEGANIGAGTIFCNYDGFQKHKTEIGEGAFIGSDSQLVAPIRIGKGAYVATGTTVTRDVPDDGARDRASEAGKTKKATPPG